jgi:glycosyltransferase involved in cell wall biosynthesis
MKKVLCLFDYGTTTMTGYATVSRNIVAELKKHFGDKLHLDICAINYFGEDYKEYEDTVSVRSVSMSRYLMPPGMDGLYTDSKKDPFGRVQFIEKLRDNEYDAIFILQDLGVIAGIVPLLRQCKEVKKAKGHKGFKSVLYFPVDGVLHPRVKNKEWSAESLRQLPKEQQQFYKDKEYIKQLDELDFFDHIITFTNYGVTQCLKHRPSLKGKLMVIHHGINTNEFYPLEEKEKDKFIKQYFGENSGKFIIGCINRNQPRKDIPTSIFGFIEAKKNWPKRVPPPFLYMHMDPEDPKGWRLRDLLSLTDLVENKDYMFSKGDINGQVDVQTLNCIYNSIDVYLSTARGGGWELSFHENMATKTLCIVPNHTSLGELAGNGDRALILRELLPISDIVDSTIRSMCHYEEVAELLIEASEYVRSSKTENSLHASIVKTAYDWATQLTWKNVCKDWIKIFETI